MASSRDHVTKVEVLFGVLAEPWVEPKDVVELEALGLMSREKSDGALLGEDVLGVGDGGAEGVAVFAENPHAVGEVVGTLRSGHKLAFTP